MLKHRYEFDQKESNKEIEINVFDQNVVNLNACDVNMIEGDEIVMIEASERRKVASNKDIEDGSQSPLHIEKVTNPVSTSGQGKTTTFKRHWNTSPRLLVKLKNCSVKGQNSLKNRTKIGLKPNLGMKRDSPSSKSAKKETKKEKLIDSMSKTKIKSIKSYFESLNTDKTQETTASTEVSKVDDRNEAKADTVTVFGSKDSVTERMNNFEVLMLRGGDTQ